MPSVWAVPVLRLGSPLSSCAPVLPYTASQGLGCSCLSYGGNDLHTSPDWFSLSFWLKLSCLKSIPASLLRVPFPVRKGEAQSMAVGPSSCCSLGPQRAAVPAWSRHCSCSEGIFPLPTEPREVETAAPGPVCPTTEICAPTDQHAPLGKALSLRGRVRVVPFQKVSL